ncbi:uncharacterized protein LOC114142520 isoform X2 [Xiphophorus couchianus]|uniref:uncharacterized protein LOC114142520 isoform X2 n=1 Tax=Xiphophorus couchianus TaxID=32473 RepID=UPI0010162971|nr:uncharacterized protein LOC114142520 isoform X2 [Xiphophorus couchianus]
MEHVKESIQKALPSLRSDLVESVISTLEMIGVSCVEDLGFVRTEDLEGILKPIQCRRLIQAFSTELQADSAPTTEPLQLNSHQLQLSPVTSGSCEAYPVPWHKMPPQLMIAVEEKKRPKPKDRRELVRIIIDDVLGKDQKRPGRAKLRNIAQQIIEQYPCSFQDREVNGLKVVGTGYDSLFIQLENRVENVMRPLSFGSTKRQCEDEMASQKKSLPSNRYGCVQWQPTAENVTNLKFTQEQLKTAFQTNHFPESDVRRMMAETYSIQRAAINRGNSISKLLEDWPFLFEAIHLFDHTTTLLGFPVQTRLAEELSKKEKTIKDFLGSRGVDIPGSDAVQLLHPESPDLDLPSTPCIFIMGEQLFKVAVDQMIVNDHIKSPIAALSYTFSMFYVLNIKYPKDMSLTLEFIQRVFLGLNPKRGSKAEMKGKKHHHIPPRLLKFVNELYDFDSPWKI